MCSTMSFSVTLSPTTIRDEGSMNHGNKPSVTEDYAARRPDPPSLEAGVRPNENRT